MCLSQVLSQVHILPHFFWSVSNDVVSIKFIIINVNKPSSANLMIQLKINFFLKLYFRSNARTTHHDVPHTIASPLASYSRPLLANTPGVHTTFWSTFWSTNHSAISAMASRGSNYNSIITIDRMARLTLRFARSTTVRMYKISLHLSPSLWIVEPNFKKNHGLYGFTQ